MDYIDIKDLAVFANHGLYEAEHALGQKFLISARLYYVTSHAGMKDDITRGLDYGVVCKEVTAFLTQQTFRLIETCAERLARHLLLTFSVLHGVDLTVAKPWAPVGLPLESVSVTIHRKWSPAAIALGSNEGDRHAHLLTAIERLEAIPGIRIKRIADFRQTPAEGRKNQPDFLNSALVLDTVLLPRELLTTLQDIEAQAGRVRKEKWSARPLDLDVIFYDDLISCSPHLILPHPRFRSRSFVLDPLADIAPYWRDPESGERVIDLWHHLQTKPT